MVRIADIHPGSQGKVSSNFTENLCCSWDLLFNLIYKQSHNLLTCL